MTKLARALTRQMDRLIETALMPGRFISYNAGFSFVRELEAVERRLSKCLSANPPQAVGLCETFLAGCYEKAGEIDDSSGSFGDFVGQLHCVWIKARQAAGADADETATRLLAWMEADPYGFCHDLERDAVKVLDSAGLTALVKQIRGRFDGIRTTSAHPGESFPRDAEYARRRWGDALRTLYRAQKDVEAYLALAHETGLTPADCLALATMLVSRRKTEDALTWVKRGIGLARQAPNSSMAAYELSKLKRVLLAKQGRGGEALHAAWSEYRQHPDKYGYIDLMKYVPKAERAAWHEKAMEADTGSDLDSPIELLLETKELERLADLVRRSGNDVLESLSHYTIEPAAKRLEKTHPDVAARLWCAQGMRVVDAKKSKYYDAALANFERARRCFERAGLVDEWQRIVQKVRRDHHRKGGFHGRVRGNRRGLGAEPKAVVPSASESALDVTQWIEIPAPTRGAPRRSRSFPASASANSRQRMRCIRSNASRSPVRCCSCHLRTTAALSSRRRTTRASRTTSRKNRRATRD